MDDLLGALCSFPGAACKRRGFLWVPSLPPGQTAGSVGFLLDSGWVERKSLDFPSLLVQPTIGVLWGRYRDWWGWWRWTTSIPYVRCIEDPIASTPPLQCFSVLIMFQGIMFAIIEAMGFCVYTRVYELKSSAHFVCSKWWVVSRGRQVCFISPFCTILWSWLIQRIWIKGSFTFILNLSLYILTEYLLVIKTIIICGLFNIFHLELNFSCL